MTSKTTSRIMISVKLRSSRLPVLCKKNKTSLLTKNRSYIQHIPAAQERQFTDSWQREKHMKYLQARILIGRLELILTNCLWKILFLLKIKRNHSYCKFLREKYMFGPRNNCCNVKYYGANWKEHTIINLHIHEVQSIYC